MSYRKAISHVPYGGNSCTLSTEKWDFSPKHLKFKEICQEFFFAQTEPIPERQIFNSFVR